MRNPLAVLLDFGPRVPTVRTSEIGECGLACVAMIAGFYGFEIDLYNLRQRFPLSTRGTRMATLKRILADMGIASRGVRVPMADIAALRCPAILHWDMNHFVVLKAVDSRRIVIADPSSGERSLTHADAAIHFTGVALEAWPDAAFTRKREKAAFSLDMVAGRFRGARSALGLVAAMSLVLLLLSFAPPLLFQIVIDQAVYRANLSVLNSMILMLLAVALTQVLLEALRTWSLQIIGGTLSFQLIGAVIRHLFGLPGAFFLRNNLADLLSRIASMSSIQDTLTKGAVTALIDGLIALTAIAVLMIYSKVMAAVVLLFFAAGAVLSWATFHSVRELNERKLVTAAQAQSNLMEAIRAMTVVKVLGREQERLDTWKTLFSRQINADLRLGRFQAWTSAGQSLLGATQLAIILYLGASRIINGESFSVGMLYAFLAFRQMFAERTSSLILQATQFRLLGLHLERLSDIVLQPSQTVTTSDDPPIEVGSVLLDRVSFSYGLDEPDILRNLSLEIPHGDYVAITGSSGVGKTTLLRVVLGLLDPTQGEVRIGGQALRLIRSRIFQQNLIGTVLQDDRMMSGTIAENIAFFDPEIDMDRVREVAAQTSIAGDIERTPMKYLGMIGDMGAALSGGQQQRLLLARALYRRPRILILDEGTANLDGPTERLVCDLVAGLDITRIVVAHRPALVLRARRIFELRDGALIERSHQEYAQSLEAAAG